VNQINDVVVMELYGTITQKDIAFIDALSFRFHFYGYFRKGTKVPFPSKFAVAMNALRARIEALGYRTYLAEIDNVDFENKPQ